MVIVWKGKKLGLYFLVYILLFFVGISRLFILPPSFAFVDDGGVHQALVLLNTFACFHLGGYFAAACA